MLDAKKVERRFPHHEDVSEEFVNKKNTMAMLYQDFASYIDNNLEDGRLKAISLSYLEKSFMYTQKAVEAESSTKHYQEALARVTETITDADYE